MLKYLKINNNNNIGIGIDKVGSKKYFFKLKVCSYYDKRFLLENFLFYGVEYCIIKQTML